MVITHIKIKNWRNFKKVELDIGDRKFLVGANASGKSNFLDAFRFLRDIATPGSGGLQRAVRSRGGVSKIRNLSARRDPEVAIELHLADETGAPPKWRYSLAIRQATRGRRQTYISNESVWSGEEQIINRPDRDDERDNARLDQTFLEQVNANGSFREIANYLQRITYLHLVPQLLRHADSIQGQIIETDPFGQGFLERIAKTPAKTRESRLGKIEQAVQVAVPHLSQLKFIQDSTSGRPHLQALFEHWRPNAGWQREDQFSDGTLRLIGLLWSLLDGDSLLLLEEPELSLNAGLVMQLAPLMHRMQRSRKRARRQIIVSTHSEALLQDSGIDGSEVALLIPGSEGTEVKPADSLDDIAGLLNAGFSVADVVLPRTRPENVNQLTLLW